MNTIHYIDSLGNIYGYKPRNIEVKEMNEEQFESFKSQQDEKSRRNQERYNLEKDLKDIRDEIFTLKDIEDRSTAENERLRELLVESKGVYRYLNNKEGEAK